MECLRLKSNLPALTGNGFHDQVKFMNQTTKPITEGLPDLNFKHLQNTLFRSIVKKLFFQEQKLLLASVKIAC